MKRFIITYTTLPGSFDEFLRASEEFSKDSRTHVKGVVEYSIQPNKEAHQISHCILYQDSAAKEHHQKTPRSQIFSTLAQTLCRGNGVEIELPEDGIQRGVSGSSNEEEYKEMQSVSLYKTQEDIEQIEKS